MAAHARLKNAFTEDEKCHYLMARLFWGFLDIWRELQTIISDWVQKHRIINIMSGPAFDYNSDGLADDKDNLHRLR